MMRMLKIGQTNRKQKFGIKKWYNISLKEMEEGETKHPEIILKKVVVQKHPPSKASASAWVTQVIQ
jgi:hypothetical protein